MKTPSDKRREKYFYPKRKSLLSLQFWRDEKGTLMFTETVNVGNLNDYASFYVFGHDFAKSNLLNEKEKRAFGEFCRSFLKTLCPNPIT